MQLWCRIRCSHKRAGTDEKRQGDRNPLSMMGYGRPCPILIDTVKVFMWPRWDSNRRRFPNDFQHLRCRHRRDNAESNARNRTRPSRSLSRRRTMARAATGYPFGGSHAGDRFRTRWDTPRVLTSPCGTKWRYLPNPSQAKRSQPPYYPSTGATQCLKKSERIQLSRPNADSWTLTQRSRKWPRRHERPGSTGRQFTAG